MNGQRKQDNYQLFVELKIKILEKQPATTTIND